MNEIKLIQAPVIQHALAVVGQSVTDRIKELNLEKQVATEDTIQTIKSLRAELNKELTTYEDQRKAVKKAVNDPYTEFEDTYKSEIAEKYKSAIDLLKDKISAFEDKIKADKKIAVMEYFVELCLSKNIDFLNFDHTGLKIDLSTSEKKYKEQCNDFVQKVRDDLDLIDTQDFKSEILVEYKQTLNASRAIKTIQDRKEAERIESERIRIAEMNNRKAKLKSIGMVYDEFARAFAFGNISMSIDQLENFSKETFNNKVMKYGQIIEQEVASMKASVAPEPNVAQQHTAPLQAPKVEAKPELYPASFEVWGTMAQLTALKNFLITNNITYKNID